MIACRVCGCTDKNACMLAAEQLDGQIIETPCWWVEPDLCSGCKVAGDVQPDPPLLFDAYGNPIAGGQ